MRKLAALALAMLFAVSTSAFAASHAGGKMDDKKKDGAKAEKDAKKDDKKK
jgi:hypothetical protein